MKTITYNSAVANLCGSNGIIKAVLINYIYNYHTPNKRKGPGHPAQISLAEFVYQYRHEDSRLWGRSFIHKNLTDLCTAGYVIKTQENSQPVFSVSPQIAQLLTVAESVMVSFDLAMACEYGIHVAIMSRYLLHVIEKSPDGIAYNLSVKDMSAVNCISPAQIYRAIKRLEDTEIIQRVKSPVRKFSRALSLRKFIPQIG